MSDTGDTYRAMREDSKKRRAHNRDKSQAILKRHGILFESRNNGAHLIIREGNVTVADFWPGTGLWEMREGRKGRGVFKLIKALQEPLVADANRFMLSDDADYFEAAGIDDIGAK